jgi:hypothetical protein
MINAQNSISSGKSSGRQKNADFIQRYFLTTPKTLISFAKQRPIFCQDMFCT